jgi:ligand-binding sensor domain-containing protein
VAALGGAARLDSADAAEVVVYTPANSPLPAIDVRVVQPDRIGGLWLGGEGVSFYDGSTWTNFTTDDGLAGSAVRAIAADDQNRIWIGTTTGLSIWTGSEFFNLTTANGLPSDDISALQDDGEVIWIGTRGGGLLRFQENQLQLFNRANSALPSDTITALTLDADGHLLIGSDQGLARFVTDTLTIDAGLEGSTINALAASPVGEAWAATPDGLQRFDGVEWSPYPTPQVQPSEITALLVDDAGDLWIGAARGGLVRYTP